MCVVFIDFSSAYNTVNRNKLWDIIQKKKVLTEKELIFLKQLTDNLYFKCDGERYYYKNGVPQGMATSPACFDIYMEDFLREVQN